MISQANDRPRSRNNPHASTSVSRPFLVRNRPIERISGGVGDVGSVGVAGDGAGRSLSQSIP